MTITFVDTPALLREMKKDLRGAISFDKETTGLYQWQHDIVSLGFGTRKNEWIIPWKHKDSPFKNNLQEIAEEIDELVQDCYLIGQNGKFDSLYMLVKHGLEWTVDFDTMLAHYLLDENKPHDLEFLATYYYGAPKYDIPLKEKQGHFGFTKRMIEYQGLDLRYTRQLKYTLSERLKDQPAVERVFKKIMMPCVKLFTEIEEDGVYIDTSKFGEAETYLQGEIKAATDDLKKWEPPPTLKGKKVVKEVPFNWGSPKQLGGLLFDKMKIPVVEKTKSGGRSTSESVLKRIDHPLVTSLLRYRGAKQQLSFFIDGWKPYLVGKYLHPSFKLHGTVTGRLSAEHPNLQQVPRDPRIRQLITAPPGWELIEADLSQIELRIAAELSGDREMIYAFTHNIDVHWLTLLRELKRSAGMQDEVMAAARRLSNRDLSYGEAIDLLLEKGPDAAAEVNPIWKELRKKAKAINFGFLYGMWWKKFMIYARDNYGVTVTEKQAQQSRTSFFELYKDLPKWHERQRRYAMRAGFVSSLSGRRRRLPEAMSDDDTPARAEALRQAINSPVQSFANELNLMAALQLREEFPRSIVRICGTVHDAILARVRKEWVCRVSARLLEIMTGPALLDDFDIQLTVPIEADLKVGAWSKGVSLAKWRAANPEFDIWS